MSIIRYYDVRCDSCEEELSSISSVGPFDTKADATMGAAEYEWIEQEKTGRWICASCLDAMKEDHDRGRRDD